LNKQLAANHPKLIEKDMQKAESDAAEVFRLYDESKKNELIEKNKKEAEERAIKRVELEDKKKAEEEARVAEETKKKTGKAPPAPKPKDPKKAASEFEERKQAILKEMGPT
jgi:colicin import membrane protein